MSQAGVAGEKHRGQGSWAGAASETKPEPFSGVPCQATPASVLKATPGPPLSSAKTLGWPTSEGDPRGPETLNVPGGTSESVPRALPAPAQGDRQTDVVMGTHREVVTETCRHVHEEQRGMRGQRSTHRETAQGTDRVGRQMGHTEETETEEERRERWRWRRVRLRCRSARSQDAAPGGLPGPGPRC